jgi:glutathione S-transferase
MSSNPNQPPFVKQEGSVPELEIIGTPHSNFTWTTRIVCIEKGVPYVHVQLRPHTPEVQRISPFGLIPVMRHGDVRVFEARAICTYVDKAFPGPSLIPSHPVKAALTEQWVSAVTTSVDRLLMRQYVLKHATPGTADGKPDRNAIDGALKLMPAQFSMLDRAVSETGYLVGDVFTLADAYLLPILFFMTKLPESAEMFAKARNLRSYFERHFDRASIRDTAPPADYAASPAYYARWGRQVA